ncbi:MAG: hypothetical protein K2R98_17905 [Gemmataceae bacterium]|nr:hypothetical protein [Gemmataceae bacterium]
MNRYSLGRWLGSCLLGPVLLAGCSHTASQNSTTASLKPSPAPRGNYHAIATSPTRDRGATAVPQPSAVPSAVVSQVPLAPSAGTEAVEQPAVASIVPVAHTEAPPEPAPKKPEPAAVTLPPVRLGHSDDYRWLMGQVEHTRLGRGWRLRYASVDEEDRHGGCVNLTGDSGLGRLTDGQFIRVEGHLSTPGNGTTAPVYHVDSWEPLPGSSR